MPGRKKVSEISQQNDPPALQGRRGQVKGNPTCTATCPADRHSEYGMGAWVYVLYQQHRVGFGRR